MPTPFQSIRADTVLLKKRVAKLPLDNMMRSLINDEVLALFESFMEVVDEKINEHDQILIDLIDSTDDLIHEDLSRDILDALDKGTALCALVEELKLDDEILAKKLKQAREDYEKAAVIAAQAVEDVTIPDEEVEEDEDANDAGSSGDDGDDTPGDGDAEPGDGPGPEPIGDDVEAAEAATEEEGA